MALPSGRLAGLVAGAALAAFACRGPSRPDVLVVTVDTLRPDALGWVAGTNPTPTLDRLAASGVAFERAISPVPITLPAHAALFSSRLPRSSGVRDNGDVVPGDLPLLSERLRAAGYRTGAVVSGYPLRHPFGLDRGFDTYDDALPLDRAGGWATRPADESVRAALRFLDAGPAAAPWFLWLHLYDPHDPYEPPERFAGPTPRAAYDGEVRFVDEAMGELERELDHRFGARKRLTILTADHGESLGEHDEATHGFFVYDATITVPLVVALPGVVAPSRSSQPARLVDVAATVLDLVGLPALAGSDGESLRPLLDATATAWKAAYIESWQPFLSYGWAPLRAVRSASAKYIEAPRPELYDLASDPREERDRSADSPEELRELRAALVKVERPPARPRFGRDDSEEAARSLAALGYLGRAAEIPAELDRGLADPKDRTELRRALHDAEQRFAAGDRAGALAGFEAVLAREPDNRYALLRSGKLLLELRRPAEAVVPLSRLAALDPLQPEAQFELAVAAIESGRDDLGRETLERLVTLQPRRAMAWSNLAFARYRTGDGPGALAAAHRAAELDPADPLIATNLRDLKAAVRR